jgi:tetratricopeptide (TPR) repeat protein
MVALPDCKSPLLSYFFLALLVFSAGSVYAQRGLMSTDTGDPGTGGNFIVQGSVFLPSGHRVDRPIRVRLVTPTRGTITTMTDENGVFSFRRLAPGSYSVVIDAEKEYETVNEQLNIVQAMRTASSTENIIPVQIRLRPKAATAFKPEVMNAELANVPKNALLLYNQAVDLGQAGKSKEAIEKLKQAITEYPNFMLAFNELGVEYLRANELNQADEALRNALKISPDSANALMNHGIVLTHMGKFELAVSELESGLKQKDQSANGHFYLGQALANLGRFGEAEQHLTRAVALGGDEVKDAHRFLGAIYLQRGERERGVAELETYLKLAPKAKDAEQVRRIVRENKH